MRPFCYENIFLMDFDATFGAETESVGWLEKGKRIIFALMAPSVNYEHEDNLTFIAKAINCLLHIRQDSFI